MNGASVLLVVGSAASNLAVWHRSHGSGPPGLLGWFVVAVAVAVDLFALGLCARYFISPGETSPEHIKRRILK